MSCTPPWQQYDCSTASATDNRTRDHSADCLPGQCAGPIAERHSILGGAGGVLGRALTGELPTPDGIGRHVQYERGLIYWTPTTGAWPVWGAIRSRQQRVGAGSRGSRAASSSGRRRPGPTVHGSINQRYQALGGPGGFLGYPIGDEEPAAGGRVSRFTGGRIYWSPASGAHEVHGAILERYRAEGGAAGPLGFPVSDEEEAPGGRVSRFQRGAVLWEAATGATRVERS
jgi:uncharacterized protein with LGFP repeats